jgi:hypothetical protein
MDSSMERIEPDEETIEPESLDPELVVESTAPHFAPPRRSTPVVARAGQPNERSRRSTLVSPIPSLMAASMRVRNVGLDSGPAVAEAVPMMAEPQMTSKQGDRSRAMLLDGESDYVVEIDEAKSDAQKLSQNSPHNPSDGQVAGPVDSDPTDDTNTDP